MSWKPTGKNRGNRQSHLPHRVEVEAMHGAAVVALTMYDMLNRLTKAWAFLKSVAAKAGGSPTLIRQRIWIFRRLWFVRIVSAGKKSDASGKIIIEKLEKLGLTVSDYSIIADEGWIKTKSNSFATKNESCYLDWRYRFVAQRRDTRSHHSLVRPQDSGN
jgi:hypothetical protein